MYRYAGTIKSDGMNCQSIAVRFMHEQKGALTTFIAEFKGDHKPKIGCGRCQFHVFVANPKFGG